MTLANKIFAITWCPRCDARKGNPCVNHKLNGRGGLADKPHDERIAQYKRRQDKAKLAA